MLHKLPTGPAPDPDEMLVGICSQCKQELHIERHKAINPGPVNAWNRGQEDGSFSDLSYAECPNEQCSGRSIRSGGVRVYLMKKEKHANDEAGVPSGGRKDSSKTWTLRKLPDTGEEADKSRENDMGKGGACKPSLPSREAVQAVEVRPR